MGNWIAINKSGSKRIIRSAINNNTVIGMLYPNELFGVDFNAGGDGYYYYIVFRNSQGKKDYGVLVDPPLSVLESAYQYKYRYGAVTIGDKQYHTFKMARTESVYLVNASYWGKVAKDCYVACRNSFPSSGDTHPYWLQIEYVQSITGGWIPVKGEGANYGFVNIGLEHGSMYNTISVDGKWVS